MVRTLSLIAVILMCVVFSARAEELVVAAPDELSRLWVPASSMVAPTYPARLAGKDTTGCVTIGYIIELDGTTSSFMQLARHNAARSPLARAVATDLFAQAAAQAIASWRYVAAAPPARTFTSATIKFAPDGNAPTGEECRVDDLAQYLDPVADDGFRQSAEMQAERRRVEQNVQVEDYRSPPPPPPAH